MQPYSLNSHLFRSTCGFWLVGEVSNETEAENRYADERNATHQLRWGHGATMPLLDTAAGIKINKINPLENKIGFTFATQKSIAE